jgi:hypothetical protein
MTPRTTRRVERVATVAVVLAVAACRCAVLGGGWVADRVDDARYASAQRRGARLALRMSKDGTLAARSPRKVVSR